MSMEHFRKHNGATAPRLDYIMDIEEPVKTISQVFRDGLKIFTDFNDEKYILPRWSPTAQVWTPKTR